MGVVAGLAGGLMQMSAANKAADAQEKAANSQMALARETRDMTRADLAPYVQSGNLGQAAYLSTLGLGAAPMIGGTAPQVETYQIPGNATTQNALGALSGRESNTTGPTSYSAPTTGYRVGGQTFGTMAEAQAYAAANPTGGTQWGGYTQSPGYQTQLRQGTDSALSAAMATGQGASGRTLQDLNTFGQGLAAQDFGNFQNRLAALGQGGQAAAGMQANNNANYAQMGTNALGSIGNAQSAGAIGAGNAFSDMMGNIVGGMGMMKANGAKPGAQGGNWWG